MAEDLQLFMDMHRHEHDENNAPNQAKNENPTDPEAHLANGVSGAQPPLEEKGARAGHRHKTAAGCYSIYETAHFFRLRTNSDAASMPSKRLIC
jgi:hypothetical protein